LRQGGCCFSSSIQIFSYYLFGSYCSYLSTLILQHPKIKPQNAKPIDANFIDEILFKLDGAFANPKYLHD